MIVPQLLWGAIFISSVMLCYRSFLRKVIGWSQDRRNNVDICGQPRRQKVPEIVPEDCCVCLEPIDDTEACWPCGHAVCTSCERKMGMEPCPLCRTPCLMDEAYHPDFLYLAVNFGATRKRWFFVSLQEDPSIRRSLRYLRRHDFSDLRNEIIRLLIERRFWHQPVMDEIEALIFQAQ